MLTEESLGPEQPRQLPSMAHPEQTTVTIPREPSSVFDTKEHSLVNKKQKTLETLSAITGMLQSLNEKKLLDQKQTEARSKHHKRDSTFSQYRLWDENPTDSHVLQEKFQTLVQNL